MNEAMNTKELMDALDKVKEKLKPLKKDSFNPHFRNKYADLNSHLEEIEPLFREQGLLLTQPTSVLETSTGQVRNIVMSEVTHLATGQTKISSLMLPDLQDPQKICAAITYYRRATLNSLLSMSSEDDDGNTASGHANKSTKGKAQAGQKKESPPSTPDRDDDF